MNDPETTPTAPVIRRAGEVEHESVDAAEGMAKGLPLDESDGAPHFATCRFTLASGAEVPKHPSDVEHEQHVLSGQYTVGIEGEEYEVSAGDSLLIPASAVHRHRNEGAVEGAFICVVADGDGAIELVE